MKSLPLLFLLAFWAKAHSQDNTILKIAFSDRSNFDITKSMGNKIPDKLYVLTSTDKWESHRFHVDENVKSDSVRKGLLLQEHTWYKSSYIFRDLRLDSVFSDEEKEHLYKLTQSTESRQLTNGLQLFSLIRSYETAKNEFFFSVTDPIFSTDKQYAFLDITTYRKSKETTELRDTYFGTTLLIYQTIHGNWVRIKKFEHLIL